MIKRAGRFTGRRVIRGTAAAGLTVCTLLVGAGRTDAANERALWALWQKHQENPEAHAEVLSGCKSFVAGNRGDALTPVVHSLAAWHLFKEGKTDSATGFLKPYLAESKDPVKTGAGIVAKGWMSRLDREVVRDALQAYYREEVQYPKALDEISKHPKLAGSVSFPKSDRFGVPWWYFQAGFKGVRGFTGQSYKLTSKRLGESSELEDALALPYAGQIPATPARILKAGENKTVVQLKISAGPKRKAGTIAVEAGDTSQEIYVAYVGQHIVILCNHSFWAVFRKP